MRKVAQGLYLFLVLYGLIYTVFIGVPTTFLAQVFAQEADGLAFMVFNFLGLIPAAFLMYFLRYYQLKWFHFMILLFSFVFGGFSLGLIFFFFPEERTTEKPNRLAAGIGLAVSVFTLSLGFTGSFAEFGRLFIEDSFVHIMTIDFIVLFGIALTLPKFKRSIWQATFMIGMFYQLMDPPALK